MAINVNRINQNNNYGITEHQVEREYSAIAMNRTVQGTGDMGKLIPIHCQELMPSQKIVIDFSSGIQFQPFVSNLFHEINGEIMTYVVPHRLIVEDWEEFITGGREGTYSSELPSYDIGEEFGKESIYDYLGFPIRKPDEGASGGFKITKLPARAYNLIYNEQIRNPDTNPTAINIDQKEVKNGYWDWSYLTRARVFQMRGITPSIPISDEMQQLEHELKYTKWKQNITKNGTEITITGDLEKTYINEKDITMNFSKIPIEYEKGAKIKIGEQFPNDKIKLLKNSLGETQPETNYSKQQGIEIQPHNLSQLGMNLNDLMIGLGIMRYQINNAKTEPRYIDQLKIRFGIYPQDARLQRPEYLGTKYFNISIDTVTQTGGDTTNSKQGNITAQAWGAGQNMNFTYEAQEHCILMSIMIIKPKPVYDGGLNRMWIKKTRFDFPTPELANLPDVPVYKAELIYTGTEKDKEIFGYQGIYEEYRTLENIVCGRLRPSGDDDNLKSYTLARFWKKEDNPTLNAEFLECKPDKARIVQYPNEPTFIYFIRTQIRTSMPLPLQSEPAEIATI